MEEWITSDVEVLAGKPCVRGTRLSVEFILELVASGATIDEIVDGYPQLTRAGVEAALRYAARAMRGEQVWTVRVPAA